MVGAARTTRSAGGSGALGESLSRSAPAHTPPRASAAAEPPAPATSACRRVMPRDSRGSPDMAPPGGDSTLYRSGHRSRRPVSEDVPSDRSAHGSIAPLSRYVGPRSVSWARFPPSSSRESHNPARAVTSLGPDRTVSRSRRRRGPVSSARAPGWRAVPTAPQRPRQSGSDVAFGACVGRTASR